MSARLVKVVCCWSREIDCASQLPKELCILVASFAEAVGTIFIPEMAYNMKLTNYGTVLSSDGYFANALSPTVFDIMESGGSVQRRSFSVKVQELKRSGVIYIGVVNAKQVRKSRVWWPGQCADSFAYFSVNGRKIHRDRSVEYAKRGFSQHSVIKCEMIYEKSRKSGSLVFYRNGISQGIAFSGITFAVRPVIFLRDAKVQVIQEFD